MAFHTWISAPQGDSLIDIFSNRLRELGLEICQEASGEKQIYAVESSNIGVVKYSKVNVLVSWVCSSKSKCQIEVRSSEPMLKKETRCSILANALKEFSPPC